MRAAAAYFLASLAGAAGLAAPAAGLASAGAGLGSRRFLGLFLQRVGGDHGGVVRLAQVQRHQLHALRQLELGEVDDVAGLEVGQIQLDVLGQVLRQAGHFHFGQGCARSARPRSWRRRTSPC
jgi:hypothetical protein